MPSLFPIAHRIVGEPVFVRLRTKVGEDDFGDDVFEFSEPVQIDNVLIKPTATTAMTTATRNTIEQGHPYAIESDIVLYFPRDYREDLRGARVSVRGREYKVVGQPTWYTDENLPYACEWNMVVKVTMADG